MTTQNTAPNSKDAFIKELQQLETEFNKRPPELELTVRDPELGVEGYLVVWNTKIGKRGPLGSCGKGGTRSTPTLSLDEVKMLASRMAMKNAGAGLPLGGAKSGLRADPSAPDFEKKFRRFVQLISPNLKENGGMYGGFGFDVGSQPIHAVWACDELKSTRCHTGKSVEMGGTDYDREGIAGLGVAVAAASALKHKNEAVEKVTYAVQGIGAMGAAVIKYFSEMGAQLVAISDPRVGGTITFDKAISSDLYNSLSEMNIEETKRLLQQDKYAVNADVSDVLYKKVDVLFPCAIQDVIGEANVNNLNCRYLVEGANNPTSIAAYDILHSKNVFVVPDFIANPGGIIAAFVEMTSDATPEENVKTRVNVTRAKELTRTRIAENVTELVSLADRFKVQPYMAGRYMALRNMLT